MICGDNPVKVGGARLPNTAAVAQSGNLYAYCGGNPVLYVDTNGQEWYHWVIIGALVAAAAVATVVTAGGAAPALLAVGSVASGMAAATLASTIAAGAFIGSSVVAGTALMTADYSSSENFGNSAGWGTVAFTAGGLVAGGAAGYVIYKSSEINSAGESGSTDYYVGPNGKALPNQYKDWIGKNELEALLKKTDNSVLQNAIKQLYRGNSFIGDGGTADALRFENETGLLLSGSGHLQKAMDMSVYLKRLIDSGTLSQSDLSTAQTLLQDLLSAIGGK